MFEKLMPVFLKTSKLLGDRSLSFYCSIPYVILSLSLVISLWLQKPYIVGVHILLWIISSYLVMNNLKNKSSLAGIGSQYVEGRSHILAFVMGVSAVIIAAVLLLIIPLFYIF